MRIRLAPGEDGLQRLTSRVDAFAARHSLPPDVRRDVHVVLDELVNNIVRHAQPRHPQVDIHLAIDGNVLQMRVVDDGEPFDPVSRPDPDLALPLEERPIGGLGLFLVRRLMEDVQYRRVRGRNSLRLQRRIVPGATAAV